ncbi:hypothetical protein E2542_SST16945 [Spatholobus suberectus]|nr:hypothetical protein E2542_SST16945 [Spatholobus suberectus]
MQWRIPSGFDFLILDVDALRSRAIVLSLLIGDEDKKDERNQDCVLLDAFLDWITTDLPVRNSIVLMDTSGNGIFGLTKCFGEERLSCPMVKICRKVLGVWTTNDDPLLG